jgi:uncharacterized protein (DUF1697 family)
MAIHGTGRSTRVVGTLRDTLGMPVVVALLRAVNVGGQKLSMAGLRDAAAAVGIDDARTYIQSGNLVGRTTARSMEPLARKLERAIADLGGFAPKVTLRTRAELAKAIDADPFVRRGEDTKLVHVLFGLQTGPVPKAALPDSDAFAPEEAVAVGRDVHLFLPNGMGRAKLPLAIGRTRFHGTARNWRTVTTLLTMADDLG